MAGYGMSDNNTPDSGAVTVGASETNTVVSRTKRISADDSLELMVRVKSSSVTVTNAVTAKLQHRWSEDEDWSLVGSQAQVSITGNGWFGFKVSVRNSTDEAQLPLAPLARLVVTTGVGDAATIDQVLFSERR